jgi:hypothetical protein
MSYTLSMTTDNTNKKNTIAYKVKFNASEIVVNDNSQSMFKSKHHIKKNYFKIKKDNFFEIILIASDFSNCFEKAKNFYRSQYNKEASSIEVTQIKRATNTSTNLSNQQKLVA